MKILRSDSDSPACNCELEQQLITEHPFTEDVLLFYINRPSVIVGKNQVIDAEIDREYCKNNGIDIVRRISGGGTVYHDYGNINYAFIITRGEGQALDRDFTAPIITALKSLGVEACVGQRRELLVNGRKISGTASLVTRDRILFHGTLLHCANLERMSLALRGDLSKRGKAVASIRSETVNIADITGSTETTEEFLKRLTDFFRSYLQLV